MRDVTSIDDELSLVAEVRSALLADGCYPGAWQVDPLLDERLATASQRPAIPQPPVRFAMIATL